MSCTLVCMSCNNVHSNLSSRFTLVKKIQLLCIVLHITSTTERAWRKYIFLIKNLKNKIYYLFEGAHVMYVCMYHPPRTGTIF